MNLEISKNEVEKKLITIISSYYNRFENLKRYCENLKKNNLSNIEIIICGIFNNIEIQYLKQFNFIQIYHYSRKTFSTGFFQNQAIEKSSNKWILKQDIDCIPEKGLYQDVINFIKNADWKDYKIYGVKYLEKDRRSASRFWCGNEVLFSKKAWQKIGKILEWEYGWEDYAFEYKLEKLKNPSFYIQGIDIHNITNKIRDELVRKKNNENKYWFLHFYHNKPKFESEKINREKLFNLINQKDVPIDIIIPTIKSYNEIKDQIQEIEKHTKENHNIIATCQKVSASKNRNIGLKKAKSDIVIMLDDDIIGFFNKWINRLLYAFQDNDVYIASARLMKPNGNYAIMNGNTLENRQGIFGISGGKDGCLPSAAIAFRKTNIRFDENYIGSGFEDTDFMYQYRQKFNPCKFVICNRCQLIHKHEKKNQGGDYFIHNRDYFCNKWNSDIHRNQTYV